MKLPFSVSMKCPLCEKPLDLQGTGGIEKSALCHVFDLYCHECLARVHVVVRKKPIETKDDK